MSTEAPPPDLDSAGSPSGPGRLASALSLALLVALGMAGAATHPSGLLMGSPSWFAIFLSAAAGALAWASCARGLGGFLLPALAGLGAALFNGSGSLLLFTGEPLLTLALAAIVLAVAALRPRPPHWLMLPVFFAIYAGVAHQAQTRVGPDGDEPQYLMVTESLLRDHDLALDQDFKEGRYAAFFSRPLRPDFRVRGPAGQIYSLHGLGLSLLILPAYALVGYPGASFFMAFLAALLVREIRRLLSRVTEEERLAEGTAWLVGLSPPIIHFAGLIFTEIPAALLLCVGLRTAVFGRRRGSSMAAAVCAATLPWLNVRYAILSAAIVIGLSLRCFRESQRAPSMGALLRTTVAPALVLAGSALAIGLYHFELWGFFDPRRVYGRRPGFSLDILPEGLPGLFFDQEFGLFVYAPIFALSIAGVFRLWRSHRALVIAGLVASVGVVATASVWPMWRGGFNPPARFLVPLVPLLAAGLALSLKRGVSASAALLAGWSLWCGLGAAMSIDTVHRDRDGVAPFFRTHSGAREWTVPLPSFVLPEDRPTRSLAWPWGGLLAAAVLATSQRRSPQAVHLRDTAAVSVAFMATAVWADYQSPRPRTPERDASRLLGHPAVSWPGLNGIDDAAWPLPLFYEPHRHPAGLVFAEALRLEAGRYQLTLTTNDGRAGVAPVLLVTRHRNQASTRQEMRVEIRGLNARSGPVAVPSLTATFAVDAAGEFDLALVGGDPREITTAGARRLR